MGNYYYLVAGLPDLVLQEVPKGFDFSRIMEEILPELEEEDRSLVQLLQYRFDCDNTLHFFANNTKTFDHRAVMSSSLLAEELTAPTQAPIFLQEFGERRKELKDTVSIKDDRSWPYLHYYQTLLEHPNLFLRQWAEFEVDLTNFIAAKRSLALGLNLSTNLLPLGEGYEKILKNPQNDFGMGNQFPWVEKISASWEDPLALELAVDEIRWAQLDELTNGHDFSIEVVMAFVLKLDSIARWFFLDPERGQEQLKKLLSYQ